MLTRAIGSYAKAAFAVREQDAINGDSQQVMGCCATATGDTLLIALLKARGQVAGDTGCPVSGRRPGSRAALGADRGHASHQTGLDADIWLTRDARSLLSRENREERCRRPRWCAMTGLTSTRRSSRRVMFSCPRRRGGAGRAADIRQCRDQE